MFIFYASALQPGLTKLSQINVVMTCCVKMALSQCGGTGSSAMAALYKIIYLLTRMRLSRI
ncbi:MAG: hypothetical protein C9356_05490 [Oleiphilus sp.]|nr:MAG: hypothetical protein C9356_05490 [Oleiphilus sp.]